MKWCHYSDCGVRLCTEDNRTEKRTLNLKSAIHNYTESSSHTLSNKGLSTFSTSQWPEPHWHSFIFSLNKNNYGKDRCCPHPIYNRRCVTFTVWPFQTFCIFFFFFFNLWSPNEHRSTFRTYNSNFSLFRKSLVHTKDGGELTVLCLFRFETDDKSHVETTLWTGRWTRQQN